MVEHAEAPLVRCYLYYFCVVNFIMLQVDDLTRKSQLQDIELEKTAERLKEAISIAGEENSKCKAAKEVIKSLTAQVSVMLMFILYIKKLTIFLGKFWGRTQFSFS